MRLSCLVAFFVANTVLSILQETPIFVLEVGTPVLESSTNRVLKNNPEAKDRLKLPGGIEGELQFDSFDAINKTLAVRLKVSKKLMGKPPEGYNSCNAGDTYVLKEKEACIYWLKDDAILIISWEYKQNEDSQAILTLDLWKIKK